MGEWQKAQANRLYGTIKLPVQYITLLNEVYLIEYSEQPCAYITQHHHYAHKYKNYDKMPGNY